MKFRWKTIRALPRLAAIALNCGLCCAAVAADTIYKSIDAEGNVSFSNTPPAPGVESEQIELPSGPSPAQQRESIEAEQKLEAQSNEIPEDSSDEAPVDEPEASAVDPTMEYQEDTGETADYDEPVLVDDGTVDERADRVRNAVDDVREIAPLPAETRASPARVR